MQKFCTECGAKLDDATGKCPICDRELTKKELRTKKREEKKAIKKEKWKKLSFKQKLKKICLRFFACFLTLLVLVCGATVALVYFNIIDIPIVSKWFDKTPEEKFATEIVSAFEANNLGEINKLLFPNNYYDIDDNIGIDFNIKEKSSKEDIGIFYSIFEKTSVSYVKTDGTQFVYNVVSPNMKNVFDGIEQIQSELELSKHIREYAQQAETIKFTVSVDFIETDGEIVANYNTEEFINAITGGLLDEYKSLYKQYYEDIKSGKVVNLK